jgi:hypothetical protein
MREQKTLISQHGCQALLSFLTNSNAFMKTARSRPLELTTFVS